MALPDRFEQVGIVVGSVILVALPVSALVGAIYRLDIDPWMAMLAWLLPGLIVGVLLALDRLPVTYHQVWAFSVSSYLLTYAGWVAFGLSLPTANRPLALLVWAVAVGLGALVAWIRPIATLRRRRQHA